MSSPWPSSFSTRPRATNNYDAMIEGFDTMIFDLCEEAANHAKGFAAEFRSRLTRTTRSSIHELWRLSERCVLQLHLPHDVRCNGSNSGSFHSGEFFHGPFEIVDKDVPFVLHMNDGKTRNIDARALTFLNRFDAKVTVVDAKDYALSGVVPGCVATYFNPMVHTAVFRTYAEALAEERQHPLTVRRYMWKLEY
jgi:hypothetical protein